MRGPHGSQICRGAGRPNKEKGQSGGTLCPDFRPPWRLPRALWRLASSGVGVAAGGRRRGGSPRLAAQTADFFLRGRALDPAEAMQTVRLEPELEGDAAPARELARAGKFARAGLHTLQSLAQVSPLSCHEGKSSAGPGFTAGTLRVTSNDPGIVQKDTGYASMGGFSNLGQSSSRASAWPPRLRTRLRPARQSHSRGARAARYRAGQRSRGDIRRPAGAARPFQHLPEQRLSSGADSVQAAARRDLEGGAGTDHGLCAKRQSVSGNRVLKDLGTAIETLNKRRGPS